MMKKKINAPQFFACGALAINILMMLFQSYSNNYYVEVLGLYAIAAAVGKVLMLLFDAGINLYVGRLSDNSKNKKGRRYPWLIATCPFYIIITVLVFIPLPDNQQWLILTYFFITMMLFQLMATFQFINYGALFPIIYTTNKERINASNWRQAFFFIGLIIGVGLPPVLFEKIGYFETAACFGLLTALVYIIFLTNIREPLEYKPTEAISLRKSFALLKERKFLTYNAANALINAILGIIITVYPFMAEYYLEVDGAWASLILGVLFIVAIAMTFVWRLILRRLDHDFSFILSIMIFCGGIFLFYFIHIKILYLLIAAIIGLGLAGIFMTQNLLQSRLLDEDWQKNKIRREGTFGSVANLIGKLAMITSAIFFGIFSLAFGYESGKNPGSNPALMFKILVTIVPLILGGIAILLAFDFRRQSRLDRIALDKKNK